MCFSTLSGSSSASRIKSINSWTLGTWRERRPSKYAIYSNTMIYMYIYDIYMIYIYIYVIYIYIYMIYIYDIYIYVIYIYIYDIYIYDIYIYGVYIYMTYNKYIYLHTYIYIYMIYIWYIIIYIYMYDYIYDIYDIYIYVWLYIYDIYIYHIYIIIHIYICSAPPDPPHVCTLAVPCLHAFKLAGTNRLTTAAMNILALRIKTVSSNFEMFGHVLDNNLSFMLYFFEKHVAQIGGTLCWSNTTIFSSIIASSMESAVDSCYTFLEGCYTDLPRNYSLLKLHIHTYIYIYIYIHHPSN